MNDAPSPETLAAQAMGDVDATSGALVPAIHPSTTYERGPDGTYPSGLVYTRADNPTYDHEQLTDSEGPVGDHSSANDEAGYRRTTAAAPANDH
jgi:hypothetical protein